VFYFLKSYNGFWFPECLAIKDDIIKVRVCSLCVIKCKTPFKCSSLYSYSCWK